MCVIILAITVKISDGRIKRVTSEIRTEDYDASDENNITSSLNII